MRDSNDLDRFASSIYERKRVARRENVVPAFVRLDRRTFGRGHNSLESRFQRQKKSACRERTLLRVPIARQLDIQNRVRMPSDLTQNR